MKSKPWIADKYWHEVGNRNWVFSTRSKQLKNLSDMKIVRHINLKLDKNPYLDKNYFVSLKINQGVINLTGTIKRSGFDIQVCQSKTMTMIVTAARY